MVDNRIFRLAKYYVDLLKNVKQTSSQPGGNKITHSPFFTSLNLWKTTHEQNLEIANGCTKKWIENSKIIPLKGRVEMRIGDAKKGGSVKWKDVYLARDLHEESWDREIKSEATDLFWECAGDLESRFSKTMGKKKKKEQYLYFASASPQKFIQDEKEFSIDMEKLENDMRRASQELKRSWLKDVEFSFRALRKEKYFINSEDSQIFTNELQYKMIIEVKAQDKDNFLIPHYSVINGKDFSQIPSFEDMMRRGNILVEELEEILKAPLEKNGAFTSILDGENTGVIMHEAVGHGLEAHRLYGEGSWLDTKNTLFKDKIGKKIAPDFLTLHDDPTREFFNDIPINGHYLFDDEGTPSRKVTLFENGVLKEYLHTRESAGFKNIESNGHCRSDQDNPPCSRMGILFLESSNAVPFAELKRSLRKELVKRNKPYGLVFNKTSGGLVLPEESFYNTYPANVFRIYQNGKMQRVRGVYVVGTPYQTLNNILQTSDELGLFNGFCGAESGTIPCSEIAPASLVKSVEINQIPRESCYEEVSKNIFD